MKVEGKDVGGIVQQLEDAQKMGLRYVTMEKDFFSGNVKADRLQFFSSKMEAEYSGHLDNTVRGKKVEVLAVREILQDMQQQTALHQIRTQNWKDQPSLMIDAGRLHTKEIARQEIFTTEIAGKLKEQQIQPDVKALRENISHDQPKFTISARQMEQGKEKAVTVTIEQDVHRAFHIQSIEPQKENERHKSMKLMQQEELLGGRLHKEDAPGVKQMMQAQREAGNRFVAFENGQEKITGKHFTGFENALKGADFVHEKAEKEGKQYLLRTVTVIEKELDRILENKREQLKGPEKELQQGIKHAKSVGMER